MCVSFDIIMSSGCKQAYVYLSYLLELIAPSAIFCLDSVRAHACVMLLVVYPSLCPSMFA